MGRRDRVRTFIRLCTFLLTPLSFLPSQNSMLTAVQSKLSETIPLVIIAFNGGKGTLDVIAQGTLRFFPILDYSSLSFHPNQQTLITLLGLAHKSPVIVIQGTGRISDAVAELVMYIRQNNIVNPTWGNLQQMHKDGWSSSFLFSLLSFCNFS